MAPAGTGGPVSRTRSMVRAIALAVADLGNRRVIGVMIRSLLVTLLIFAGIGAALVWLLHGADPCGWAGFDACPLDTTSSGIGAVLATGLAIWLLFPAVAVGVVAAFADEVIGAVEARDYPAAAVSARPLGPISGAVLGLRSSLRVLAYNLLALPLYLLLLVTGIGTPILFVVVNGIALAADLGSMVAMRHVDRPAQNAWLRSTRIDRWAIGAATTAMFLVPFVNLIAPIVGAAAMTHLFQAQRRR